MHYSYLAKGKMAFSDTKYRGGINPFWGWCKTQTLHHNEQEEEKEREKEKEREREKEKENGHAGRRT